MKSSISMGLRIRTKPNLFYIYEIDNNFIPLSKPCTFSQDSLFNMFRKEIIGVHMTDSCFAKFLCLNINLPFIHLEVGRWK